MSEDPLSEIQERADDAVRQVSALAGYEPLSAAVHGLAASVSIMANVMGETLGTLTPEERDVTREALGAVQSILRVIPDVTREQSKLD